MFYKTAINLLLVEYFHLLGTMQYYWFRNVLWDSVRSINDRLGCIDQVRFLTAGVVTCLTRHLEHIRLAQTAG